MELPIEIDQAQISAFCEEHHIIKLALFGSVLTDHFGEKSDVDVLFEYDPKHIPTLLDIAGMEDELSEIIGRKTDMRTPKDLSRLFREEVVQKALVQYAA